jgi:hypothetical protein
MGHAKKKAVGGLYEVTLNEQTTFFYLVRRIGIGVGAGQLNIHEVKEPLVTVWSLDSR